MEIKKNFTSQKILKIHEWKKDKLISIVTTKCKNYCFKPGQFARVGITKDDGSEIIWRALSIVSAPQEKFLEFYFTIVQNGVFSSLIKNLKIDNSILVENKSYGFLTLDQIYRKEDYYSSTTNNNLWLISTGSGLSAFISILRDKETWKYFRKIILVHSTKFLDELAYKEELEELSFKENKFLYIPIISEEKQTNFLNERVNKTLTNGKLEHKSGEKIDSQYSKVMLCGNPMMISSMRELLNKKGFYTSKKGVVGNLAMERYWI